MEEAVQRNIDDALPLRFRHAGQRRVVVHAGVVDHDLHRAVAQHHLDRVAAGSGIGNIEGDRLRAAARGDDVSDDISSAREVGIRVDDDVVAVRGEATADRAAEAAAAAGDEGALGVGIHVVMLTVRVHELRSP